MLRAARNFVYYKFLRRGHAPTWAEFMTKFGLSRQQTADLLSDMEDAHDIVLLPNKSGSRAANYILMSHPFSNIATPHRAYLDSQAVNRALSLLDNDHDVNEDIAPSTQHNENCVQRYGN